MRVRVRGRVGEVVVLVDLMLVLVRVLVRVGPGRPQVGGRWGVRVGEVVVLVELMLVLVRVLVRVGLGRPPVGGRSVEARHARRPRAQHHSGIVQGWEGAVRRRRAPIGRQRRQRH